MRLEAAPGGLTRADIDTPLCQAEIYLHGAHVTRWTPAGQRPVLFTSSRSFFAPDKPIRGGVPVIFPWFGPRSGGQPGPMHGLARTAQWTLDANRARPDGTVELDLSLPAHNLAFHVAFGAQLEMELEVLNPGATDFVFEEALHTYFAIGDIHQLSLSGLEGTGYLDKTDNFQRKRQPAEPIRIAQETDQVHLNTAATCVIDDPAWARRIIVEKSGSATTVVWNPWIAKAAAMPDMAPGDWREFLCVETANAGENAVHLAPGATHRMRAVIRVE